MEGKTVLITGGSSGIGRTTAKKFASAGANVVIAARDFAKGNRVVEELLELSGTVKFIQADMAKPKEIKSLIEQIIHQFGQLDIAVNNAGTAKGGGKPIIDFSEDEFDEVMGSNLKGVWACMKYEIGQMLKQDPIQGSIVNISSVNGLGGGRNGSLYSASKSGVIALSKSAAQEYAQQGIRVNVVAAGGFETPMLDAAMKKAVGNDPDELDKAKINFASVIPMRRIGNPNEAADAIFWLCSDQSSYVTGHTLIADGGLTAYAR